MQKPLDVIQHKKDTTLDTASVHYIGSNDSLIWVQSHKHSRKSSKGLEAFASEFFISFELTVQKSQTWSQQDEPKVHVTNELISSKVGFILYLQL